MIDSTPPAYKVKLPDFEGPLDLLLHLIQREEMDITTVSLASVTRQYLEYLAYLESIDAEALADFLVVAAKLILIKSQALLPRPPELIGEDDDVGDDLIQQLITYKQFKEVAGELGQLQTENRQTFLRVVAPPKVETKVDLSGVSVDDLLKMVRQALEIEKPALAVGTVVKPFTLTIRDQINMLQERMRSEPRLSFKRILRQARSRIEIIVTFLAMLELLKRRVVRVEQDTLFGDIVIVPSDEEPLMDEYETEGQ